MARVTVEDCVTVVPNRFDLVILSAQRARDVSAGAGLTVDRDNDKNPVIALREIAEKTVLATELEEAVIRGMQKFVDIDEPEEEGLEMLSADSIKQVVAEDLSQIVEEGPVEESEVPEDDSAAETSSESEDE